MTSALERHKGVEISTGSPFTPVINLKSSLFCLAVVLYCQPANQHKLKVTSYYTTTLQATHSDMMLSKVAAVPFALLALFAFLGVDCYRVRFESAQGLGSLTEEFEARVTLAQAAATVLLPAFGVKNVPEAEVSDYITFVIDIYQVPMNNRVARVYQQAGHGEGIQFYITSKVVPQQVRFYAYDRILSKKDRGTYARESNHQGKLLKDFGKSNVCGLVGGVIRPIDPNTPTYLLPRNEGDKSIVEVFERDFSQVALYNLDDKQETTTVSLEPNHTRKTLADLAENPQLTGRGGVEFFYGVASLEQRLPYWMLVPTCVLTCSFKDPKTHVQFRDCYDDVVFLPLSPGRSLPEYIADFRAKLGEGCEGRLVFEGKGARAQVTDANALLPSEQAFYYVVKSDSVLSRVHHIKDEKWPKSFAPQEGCIYIRTLEDTLKFYSADCKPTDIKIVDTDPQSYVSHLGLGDLSRKIVVFKRDFSWENIITDLTEISNGQVFYEVVDNWIEYQRADDAGAPVHVVAPVKPGMTFAECRQKLMGTVAASEFAGAPSVEFKEHGDDEAHTALTQGDFGQRYHYTIAHRAEFIDLGANLQSHVATVVDPKDMPTGSLTEFMHKQFGLLPKSGHKFLFYEDKDRRSPVADAPVPAPPKSLVYFEEVPKLVNFVITPREEGSKEVTISLPLDSGKPTLGPYLVDLIREAAVSLNKSIDVQELALRTFVTDETSFKVAESKEALVSFFECLIPGSTKVHTLLQFPRMQNTALGEYSQLISEHPASAASVASPFARIRAGDLKVIPKPHEIFEYTPEPPSEPSVVAVDLSSGKQHLLKFQGVKAGQPAQPTKVVYLEAIKAAVAADPSAGYNKPAGGEGKKLELMVYADEQRTPLFKPELNFPALSFYFDFVDPTTTRPGGELKEVKAKNVKANSDGADQGPGSRPDATRTPKEEASGNASAPSADQDKPPTAWSTWKKLAAGAISLVLFGALAFACYCVFRPRQSPDKIKPETNESKEKI